MSSAFDAPPSYEAASGFPMTINRVNIPPAQQQIVGTANTTVPNGNGVTIDQGLVDVLVSMGFPKKYAIIALIRCNNNLDEAIQLIIENNDDAAMNQFASELEQRNRARDVHESAPARNNGVIIQSQHPPAISAQQHQAPTNSKKKSLTSKMLSSLGIKKSKARPIGNPTLVDNNSIANQLVDNNQADPVVLDTLHDLAQTTPGRPGTVVSLPNGNHNATMSSSNGNIIHENGTTVSIPQSDYAYQQNDKVQASAPEEVYMDEEYLNEAYQQEHYFIDENYNANNSVSVSIEGSQPTVIMGGDLHDLPMFDPFASVAPPPAPPAPPAAVSQDLDAFDFNIIGMDGNNALFDKVVPFAPISNKDSNVFKNEQAIESTKSYDSFTSHHNQEFESVEIYNHNESTMNSTNTTEEIAVHREIVGNNAHEMDASSYLDNIETPNYENIETKSYENLEIYNENSNQQTAASIELEESTYLDEPIDQPTIQDDFFGMNDVPMEDMLPIQEEHTMEADVLGSTSETIHEGHGTVCDILEVQEVIEENVEHSVSDYNSDLIQISDSVNESDSSKREEIEVNSANAMELDDSKVDACCSSDTSSIQLDQDVQSTSTHRDFHDSSLHAVSVVQDDNTIIYDVEENMEENNAFHSNDIATELISQQEEINPLDFEVSDNNTSNAFEQFESSEQMSSYFDATMPQYSYSAFEASNHDNQSLFDQFAKSSLGEHTATESFAHSLSFESSNTPSTSGLADWDISVAQFDFSDPGTFSSSSEANNVAVSSISLTKECNNMSSPRPASFLSKKSSSFREGSDRSLDSSFVRKAIDPNSDLQKVSSVFYGDNLPVATALGKRLAYQHLAQPEDASSVHPILADVLLPINSHWNMKEVDKEVISAYTYFDRDPRYYLQNHNLYMSVAAPLPMTPEEAREYSVQKQRHKDEKRWRQEERQRKKYSGVMGNISKLFFGVKNEIGIEFEDSNSESDRESVDENDAMTEMSTEEKRQLKFQKKLLAFAKNRFQKRKLSNYRVYKSSSQMENTRRNSNSGTTNTTNRSSSEDHSRRMVTSDSDEFNDTTAVPTEDNSNNVSNNTIASTSNVSAPRQPTADTVWVCKILVNFDADETGHEIFGSGTISDEYFANGFKVLTLNCNDQREAVRLCERISPPIKESKLKYLNGNPNNAVISKCFICHRGHGVLFSLHNCKNCGYLVCNMCSMKIFPDSILPLTYNKEHFVDDNQLQYAQGRVFKLNTIYNNYYKTTDANIDKVKSEELQKSKFVVRICNNCSYMNFKFVDACRRGDLLTAYACSKVGNINPDAMFSVSRNKEYPLHFVAKSGNVDFMKWLVEDLKISLRHKCNNLPKLTKETLTAMAIAAKFSRMDMLRYLIKNTESLVSEITDVHILQIALHNSLEGPASTFPGKPYVAGSNESEVERSADTPTTSSNPNTPSDNTNTTAQRSDAQQTRYVVGHPRLPTLPNAGVGVFEHGSNASKNATGNSSFIESLINSIKDQKFKCDLSFWKPKYREKFEELMRQSDIYFKQNMDILEKNKAHSDRRVQDTHICGYKLSMLVCETILKEEKIQILKSVQHLNGQTGDMNMTVLQSIRRAISEESIATREVQINAIIGEIIQSLIRSDCSAFSDVNISRLSSEQSQRLASQQRLCQPYPLPYTNDDIENYQNTSFYSRLENHSLNLSPLASPSPRNTAARPAKPYRPQRDAPAAARATQPVNTPNIADSMPDIAAELMVPNDDLFYSGSDRVPNQNSAILH